MSGVVSAEREDFARAAAIGEFHLATCRSMAGRCPPRAEGTVLTILDLSQSTFTDATSFGVIASVAVRRREADRRLAPIPGPHAVQTLVDIAWAKAVASCC
jgi:hypothetical protein